MSLMLKGIDLPKEYTQVIAITPNGEVWQINPIWKNERLEAEAIQIPKDHGRLIDGGALYKLFEDALDKNALDDWWEAGAVLDNIELAPTILEAENL